MAEREVRGAAEVACVFTVLRAARRPKPIKLTRPYWPLRPDGPSEGLDRTMPFQGAVSAAIYYGRVLENPRPRRI